MASTVNPAQIHKLHKTLSSPKCSKDTASVCYRCGQSSGLGVVKGMSLRMTEQCAFVDVHLTQIKERVTAAPGNLLLAKAVSY